MPTTIRFGNGIGIAFPHIQAIKGIDQRRDPQ
jgi:hypothetical protein